MPGVLITFGDIVSGERRGVRPGLARAALFVLSVPYRLATGVRNRLYDWKLRAVRRLDCKVISVGNLTTGGTGKTPLVEYLAEYLSARGEKVSIISRGYGAAPGEPNDEKRLLHENLPHVPHLSGRNRYTCGLAACRNHKASVVILDDGFQHRGVGRDLDIVTVDAMNPLGYGHFLPRGLLRESPASFMRADVVVLTRAKSVAPEELARLENEILKYAPQAMIVHAAEEVRGVEDLKGRPRPLDALRGLRAAAFCAIGNPAAFRRTLQSLGVKLSVFLAFDDHHKYTTRDLKVVERAATAENAEAVFTTQKDRVKLQTGFHWKRDVLTVRIEMRVTKGEAEFKRRIDEILKGEAPVEKKTA